MRRNAHLKGLRCTTQLPQLQVTLEEVLRLNLRKMYGCTAYTGFNMACCLFVHYFGTRDETKVPRKKQTNL